MADIFLFVVDEALRAAIIEQCALSKFDVTVLNDSVSAFFLKAESNPESLLVLDESAYMSDGMTTALVAHVRQYPHAVILVMGSSSDIEHATETFIKPFRLGHFLARVRYYLESAPLLREQTIGFGPYRLEPQNRRIMFDGSPEPIKLTEKETSLLVFLANQAGPVTRREVLAAVWGYDERIETHTLETHIYQLRRKLDKDNENWLRFESGAYRLARS
jgi:DNA-binding response OmpR family regulator